MCLSCSEVFAFVVSFPLYLLSRTLFGKIEFLFQDLFYFILSKIAVNDIIFFFMWACSFEFVWRQKVIFFSSCNPCCQWRWACVCISLGWETIRNSSKREKSLFGWARHCDISWSTEGVNSFGPGFLQSSCISLVSFLSYLFPIILIWNALETHHLEMVIVNY